MIRNELLLEIGTEELPVAFVAPALEHLKKNMAAGLSELGLACGEPRVAATPRRLVIRIPDLVECQPDRRQEILGPSRMAAFDADNNPTKAALGFAKSKGAAVDDLKIVNTPKGEYMMLIKEQKGEMTEKLLSSLLPKLILDLSFPKAMRWGSSRISFARPIHWLLALYNGKVVPFEIGGIVSGSTTRGHRFMAPHSLEVMGFDHYLEVLRQAHVLVDIATRRQAVMEEINAAVTDMCETDGGRVKADEVLVETVCNLVEFPHGVCGVFDERFLALPDAVLITAMREHQKYFPVTDADGKLLPYFVAVNNTAVKDKRLAAAGHQRVLRARLEDALFFFKEDQTRPLADRVADLGGLVFQNRLGTMLEKSERITRLAGLLAGNVAPDSVSATERAAFLAKADLLTAMVKEFPTLQGIMGRDYALLDGEKNEVATAILEHYMPVRAGAELPVGIPGALVGLADRMDTIAGCFGIEQIPTGASDPYGLRRLALGLLHIIEKHAFELSLTDLCRHALTLYGDKLTADTENACRNIMDFIKGRFVNDLISRGLPGEAVEAVTTVSFDDVMDCRIRIAALAAISKQPNFTMLAGAFKRIMNIIGDNREVDVDEALLHEAAERKLYDAFMSVNNEAQTRLLQREYDRALDVILRMKEPVDTFFDDVMVMSDDPALRKNRLNLLAAIAQLFLRIGDFSKMYAVATR